MSIPPPPGRIQLVQNDPEVVLKCFKNDTKMIPKSTQKWSQRRSGRGLKGRSELGDLISQNVCYFPCESENNEIRRVPIRSKHLTHSPPQTPPLYFSK